MYDGKELRIARRDYHQYLQPVGKDTERGRETARQKGRERGRETAMICEKGG